MHLIRQCSLAYCMYRTTYIYIIFEKGGNPFNHIETYNKFKAKFVPENDTKPEMK